MLVVSDTSPLFALDHLWLVPVLCDLYQVIYVPPAVERELAVGTRKCKPLSIRGFPFIEVRQPSSLLPVITNAGLDPGETEALSLATEIGATLILIDEIRGRRIASSLGFDRVGVLGVLTVAKAAGLVPEVEPLIDRLVAGIGFFVSDQLGREVLRRAGE